MYSLEKYKNTISDAVVFVGGVLLTTIVTIGALWADLHLGIICSEASFTENLQLVFIALTIFSFIRFRRENPKFRHMSILIIGFFCVIFIRECDGVLDEIRHGFWIVPALAVTALACFFGFRKPQKCLQEGLEMLASPLVLVIAGLVLLLVWSRLFGMNAFWKCLMEDSYMRTVKVAAEEGSELLAYGLIFTGAALTRRWFRRRVPAGD